jgi:hypothetical protein
MLEDVRSTGLHVMAQLQNIFHLHCSSGEQGMTQLQVG